MEESDPIMEGFICPMCHKDLRSPNNLITHFQDLHSEEQALLKSIKDIYGKAKKKILKLDEKDLEVFKKEIILDKYYLEISLPQEPGSSKSQTEFFRNIRRERLEHRTTETNKLIIRLDRLLQYYGTDRKQHEQELVAWIDGSNVSRCPTCAASFNITRRQHHCRLCGSIMCNSCSFFLSYNVAQTIVTPVNNLNGREHTSEKESESLRICNHCLSMLESRRRVQIEQMMQPIICQLYTHLQKNKVQVQGSVDMYNKMYNSLISGETTYLLQDLQALRTAIADQAQLIDTLSKKIASIPVDDDNPKAIALQQSIRKSTSAYIKDNLLTLAAPPCSDDLERIKKERTMKSAEEEFLTTPKVDIKKVAVTTGWSPANISNENAAVKEDDPLVEQMNIVRNYIEQASQAKRFEEVASLKENLKMLTDMYRQQHGNSKGKNS